MAPTRKRPATTPSGGGGNSIKASAKQIRAGVTRGGGGAVVVQQQPSRANNKDADASAPTPDAVPSSSSSSTTNRSLKERFIQIFDNPVYKNKGISNSLLKEQFGNDEADFNALPAIINELTAESRLTMSRTTSGELFYQLVSAEVASQFHGLDVSAKMVYQVIERAGNLGIWTKDIRIQTNIQQQALNKIFKALESRQLIKPVKSVTAKSKKLYMLYNLIPSKELTGGVWYSDLEFDHEFISELRTFLLQCVRRLNGGKGVTLTEILEKMKQAKISRVDLSTSEVAQLVQTLVFDHMVEVAGETAAGDTLYVAARKVTPMCEFKWWDVLAPDFCFRKICFEDGVESSAHEPHYHTA